MKNCVNITVLKRWDKSLFGKSDIIKGIEL